MPDHIVRVYVNTGLVSRKNVRTKVRNLHKAFGKDGHGSLFESFKKHPVYFRIFIDQIFWIWTFLIYQPYWRACTHENFRIMISILFVGLYIPAFKRHVS